jgi:hypothetical protein
MPGMVRIFDGLYVDQLFQKNERGETVFYPHGLLGRGYLLPAEREASIRQRMRLIMLVALVIGISFGFVAVRMIEWTGTLPLTGWLVAGGGFVLLLGLIAFFQTKLAAGLEPVSTPPPSVREFLRRGRQARASWTYWVSIVLGLVSLLLAGGGFAVGVAEDGLLGFAAALFFLLVGAMLTWDGVLGLIERSKAAKAD